MNKQKKADLLLLMITAFWGTSYYLTDISLTDLPPMFLNAFRFLSAFFVLGIVFRKKLMNMIRHIPDFAVQRSFYQRAAGGNHAGFCLFY